jgi:hypothetical protein
LCMPRPASSASACSCTGMVRAGTMLTG